MRHELLFAVTEVFYCTDQSVSSGVNSCLVCQDLRILWDPTFSRCVHNLQIYFNIILLFRWFVLFRICDKTFLFYEFPMAACPIHPMLLDFVTLITFREKYNL